MDNRLTRMSPLGWQLYGKILVRGDVSVYYDAIRKLAAYEDTGLTPDEIAALRDELDAAQRRADSAVGWADCIIDVMTSGRRGIVEERFSALAGYRKWRETDRRGPDAPSKEAQP